MSKTIKKILFLLNSSERKHAIFLLFMIIIMALIDMIGVASILPFMAAITNPTLIESNLILSSLFERLSLFGVENHQQFLLALGVAMFLLLIVSLALKAITSYIKVLFIQMLEHSIGKRLIENYLNQSYSWFLNRNSAELGKTILSEIQKVAASGISPLIELIANSIVAISFLMLVIIVEPKLAIIVGLSLAGAYSTIYFFLNNYINRLGKERLKNNLLRFTLVSEAFGAAKEVKVANLEQRYVYLFSKFSKIFARTQAFSQAVALLPRFILEAIAFGGILLMILYLMSQTGSFNNALPVISLYIFVGYRLLPAVQQIYSSLTELTFIDSAVNKLYDDIKSLRPVYKSQDQDIISFNKSITLNNIHYSYPYSSRAVLKDINLTIPAKSMVGLVGTTGSGKTTTVDIILGLLHPQKGTLEVDGKIITIQNVRSWQRSIGYVPQHIYLSDDTIAANIAFGVELADVNQLAIERASKIANLHDFVIDELPKKYNTVIGERGVRLSGGQRQRIGIARALYHNPKILILDEATSALDNQTEKAVMDAIDNISKDITIILIAHRLETVKKCDIIYKLEKGKILK